MQYSQTYPTTTGNIGATTMYNWQEVLDSIEEAEQHLKNAKALAEAGDVGFILELEFVLDHVDLAMLKDGDLDDLDPDADDIKAAATH